MFRSPRHNYMLDILSRMNADMLNNYNVYFGGGTSLTMQLGEYRESFDLDFICASRETFLHMRNLIKTTGDLASISDGTIKLLRHVRIDRDSIRAAVQSPYAGDGMRLEIIYEDRVPQSGTWVSGIPVPILDHGSALTAKLCANSDRWSDRSTYSRDIIDIGAMLMSWPELTGQEGIAAFSKAEAAYGQSIFTDYNKSIQLFEHQFQQSCSYLGIEQSRAEQILETLCNFPADAFKGKQNPALH